MKKISFLLVLFVAMIASSAKSQTKFENWPALGSFHDVISATFHPSEKGNFDPIKQRSGELADKAVALSKSVVPAQYNKPEVKAAVKELLTKSTELNQLVMKKAKDDKLNKSLIAVHDAFHKIVGLCTDEKEHH
ncbi:MAG: hypothetical protein EOO88_03400 [Pedobacter sp.]|nr:MAG: hypothetical protein EOO88_03400 [Pedobacter sp.]